MAHDQDQWRENKMSPAELYYLGLSETYLSELEDYTQPLIKTMQAKGAIMEIESDLLSFQIKNPTNLKAKKQEGRIQIIKESIEYFDKIGSVNQQLRLVLRKNARENFRMKQEIKALKADNEMLNNLIKEDE